MLHAFVRRKDLGSWIGFFALGAVFVWIAVSPSVASAQEAHAQFTIRTSDGDEVITYDEDNLIHCSRTSATMLWVRLAEELIANGGEGPHLDLDLCEVEARTRLDPMNPRRTPCPGGPKWALWWHPDATLYFVNTDENEPCTAEVTLEGDRLAGSFGCDGIVDPESGAELSVVDGRFACTLVAGQEPVAPGAGRGATLHR